MGKKETTMVSKPKQKRLLEDISVVIFDMDGTLYQLDGPDGKFIGSTLEQTVLANTRVFIRQKEKDITERAIDELMQVGLSDVIGISSVLAKRYGISRQTYFDTVWDIDPKNIVKKYEDACEVVDRLFMMEKKLILLTAAPKRWQKNVFDFLNLEKKFMRIYTGEHFNAKKEIFGNLIEEFAADALLSIGDQEHTDIIPAKQFGMKTWLVHKSNPIRVILKEEI